ncbi:MAG: serine/threonine protein kinase, partial [Deltaproteobacteria bacterium]|nr:serine/threonine protein kinase [Deltaproteobacteria bacterium]
MHVGKYELKQELGKGGFGMVFRARDTALGRDCALKFLLPEHTEKQDLLQRFLQEARTAATIVHGGIVTVFECGVVEEGEAEGMAYIAMELLQGESLAARLDRGPLPPELAIEVARQVASALGAAHAAGIVHRDLKPDNVWLVPDVASAIGLRVKVLDFGIAKLAEGHATGVQTQTIQIFGTPHYMSPEQCRSTAGVDGRTDIYALGVMLFEMLAGGRPFEGVPAVLIAAHQLLPPPALRTVKPEVSADLEGLVTVMLAKEADERPRSMDDVMARLEPMRRTTGNLAAVSSSPSLPAASNSWRPATPPPVTPAPAPRPTPVPGS